MRLLSILVILISFIDTVFVRAETTEKYLREVLPNGLTVIIKYNPDSRVFGVNILGRNRAAWEPPGKEGITDFVNRMLLKGSTNKNAAEIQDALDNIGAQITTNDDPYLPYDDRYTWRAFSFIKFQTIDEYANEGLKTLFEIVSSPSFPQEEIEATKKQVLGYQRMESSSTSQSCRNLFYATLFENHPLAKPVMGTSGTVASFSRDDLIAYHKKYYSPQNMILAIVSNINPTTVLKWVKKSFGKMVPYPTKSPTINIPVQPAATIEKVSYDMHKDKEQDHIYIGGLTPGMKSPDAADLILAVEVLSSRLKQNLREKQGLAYSVGADISMLGDFGWYIAAIGTGYQNYYTAKDGMINEINRVSTDSLSQQELDRARNSLWGSSLMRNMNGVNQAYNLAFYEFIGLPYNFDDQYEKFLGKATPHSVKTAAAKYLDSSHYVMAVVGREPSR